MKVKFQHAVSGLTKDVKVGFSWTSFFFGVFPFFFRGMPIQGGIWLVVSMFTMGISNIYLWFTINKTTAHYYLENGYKPVGPGWDYASSAWGVQLPPGFDARHSGMMPQQQAPMPTAQQPDLVALPGAAPAETQAPSLQKQTSA